MADEQLSMVTALDIAMTTHFMGKKDNKREGNTMELIGEGMDDRTHETLPPFSLYESLCVSLSKHQTQ